MDRKRDKFKFSKFPELFSFALFNGGWFPRFVRVTVSTLPHGTQYKGKGPVTSSRDAELQNKIDARNTNFQSSDHSAQSWVPFFSTRNARSVRISVIP